MEGVAVTATASDADGATITVNGAAVASGGTTGDIPLSVGANTINVICTAEDEVYSTTYTVTVTRQLEPLGNDSALSGLHLSEGTLDPAFDTGTTALRQRFPTPRRTSP